MSTRRIIALAALVALLVVGGVVVLLVTRDGGGPGPDPAAYGSSGDICTDVDGLRFDTPAERERTARILDYWTADARHDGDDDGADRYADMAEDVRAGRTAVAIGSLRLAADAAC